MELMNLFTDIELSDALEDVEDAISKNKTFKLTNPIKDTIIKNADYLLQNKIIKTCNKLQCLECGTYDSGVYLLEKDTSNAVCIECVDTNYLFNPNIIELVYVV